VWEGLRAQVYLGDDAFVQRMQSLLTEPIRDVPHAQQRPMPQPLAHFVQAHAAHPQEGMRAAYAMRAIAEAFGVHEATVSRAVKRRERAVESA
jgi:DNA-directed RNA polymerase specialized sigma54-like protein